ncbi:MAG: hypothetical protein MO847_04210 [Candidatus Protistobacter heckmanni]|nr:hypothetical protein [Candidatus Protistobacter heckmanni]
MSENLIVKQDGRILRVTLNHPENAVADGMAAQLCALLDKAHLESDVVVVRSAGPDFCTGRVRDAGAPPPPPKPMRAAPNTTPSSTATRPSATARCPSSSCSKAA